MAFAMILGTSAGTAFAASLPIPDFGAIVDEMGAQMRPDPKMDYRVVFGVTKAGPAAGKPSPSLDRVAIVSEPATGIVARTREGVAP